MGIRTQKQVMVGTEKLAGRALRRASRGYKRGVVDPLVKAIAEAGSPREAVSLLNATLRRMKTSELEEALGDLAVQGAMIGRATALPKSRARGAA
jgi:hypothetical protein